MPQYKSRNLFLWTLATALLLPSLVKASFVLPPVLSNPSSCNLGLSIKDFSCDASHFYQIDVLNAPGNALGQNVQLKEVRVIIEHEWAADLDITLISPNDVAVQLSADNGSGEPNYGDPNDCNQYTTFLSINTSDACSVPSIESASAPFIGTFLPEQNFLPIHDGTDPNGLWTLQVCDDGKEHEGTLEFVELVFEANSCLNPTDLRVLNTSSNTALLDWTASSFCNNSIIELGPPGFTPGTNLLPGSMNSFVIEDSCPPILLTGLDPSSEYEVYIRENCSTGFSFNACPIQFSTTCLPPSITLKENFDSQTNCTAVCGVPCPLSGTWSNSLIDDYDWIVNDQTNITSSGTGPSDDNPGGGKYIYVESSQSLCRNGAVGSLISNCIEVIAGADSCDMSYDYLMYGVHVNALQLEYRELDSTQWVLLDRLEKNKGDQWITRYIDLDPLNGKTVQFRFSAIGGNGSRADIALDNIHFYGSLDLGPPPFVYYQDHDMDGYGGQTVYFSTCTFTPNTPGFVPNNLDCDDDNPLINPAQPEFPCDGIDRNCNGAIDEFDFSPPYTKDTTICSGQVVSFEATATYGGQIYWSSDSSGSDTLHIGATYLMPGFPANFTSTPISITLYAQEVLNPICLSSNRSSATITILPQADIMTTDNPSLCKGSMFDLSTVDVIDANGSNGLISYHNTNQINPGNVIDPIVEPQVGETYYIASTPNGGCTDIVAITFDFLDSPESNISGQDSVCKNSSQQLLGVDTGDGHAAVNFYWNTGDSTNSINLASNPSVDSTTLVFLSVVYGNGCSDTDSLKITTIENIRQVKRVIEDVTVCGGNNGSIELVPLTGTPPFDFSWNNGSDQTGDSLLVENLAQGTYSFTITDSSPQQCEHVIPFTTVNGPGAIVANSEVLNVGCNGGNDGAIYMNVNGNNPVINWDIGSQNDSLFNLSAGTYTVTISDGNCENIIDFEITQPNKITVNPILTPPSCNNSSDGSIDLNVFGGSPPYQYQWLNGLNTKSINNLAAGNYPVTITDSRGCEQAILALELVAPDLIYYDTTALLPPSCFEGQDGRISIKPKGGTSPFDVDWSNGAMGTTINNLIANNYTVSIEDANGCLLIESIELEAPSPIALSFETIQNPSCKGKEDGAISVLASGGSNNFIYEWSNMADGPDNPNLPEGNYTVLVTDENECQLLSDTVQLKGPELMDLEAFVQQPPCIGRNEGSITVFITDPPGVFSYDWNIDESGPSISNQAPGTYIVTVTDENTQCQLDTSFILTANQPMSLNIDSREPACFGQHTGEIYLIPTGGLEPYSYFWGDSNDTNEARFALAEGNYIATVTDANNCIISTGDIPLSYPPPIEIDLLTLDIPFCNDDSTGTIEIDATGGTGPLSFHWSTGDTLSQLNDLGSGAYTVSVTDINNCTEDTLFNITLPAPLTLDRETFIADCVSLDSICINVEGGIAPYVFNWNNGDSTYCLIDVPVGDYGVTVTDRVGCSQELMSIKVDDNISPIFLQQLSSKDSICFGEADGALAIAVEGGAFPYQFNWQSGASGVSTDTVLSYENLSPGDYWVTITDNNGCTSVSPIFSIIEGTNLNANLLIADVNCHNGTDGSIQVIPSGSFSPYQSLIMNAAGDTLSTDFSITGLTAGDYEIQIADGLNCISSYVETVTEPLLPLGLDSFIVAHPDCQNSAIGSVQVQPIGGVDPYRFEWSNGDSTQNIMDLQGGNYTLLITDENDCAFQQTFTVSAPDELLLDDYEIIAPDCFGFSDGAIDINMTGGTAPYFYDWGTSNEEDLMSVPAGSYELTVYDSTFLCLFDTTFIVPQPNELSAIPSSSPSISGSPNGSASIDVSGGTSPYSYLWETGETTDTINGLLNGWYEYTVTDSQGCQIFGGVMVDLFVSTAHKYGSLSSYKLYPNPASVHTNLEVELNKTSSLQIEVYNTLGTVIYSEETQSVNNATWTIPVYDWPDGLYQLYIRSNGQTILVDQIVKL